MRRRSSKTLRKHGTIFISDANKVCRDHRTMATCLRAIRITAYLANGGALEHAQAMTVHETPRTTKLYDRNKEKLTQDEVERITL
jgi:hypothetical protein